MNVTSNIDQDCREFVQRHARNGAVLDEKSPKAGPSVTVSWDVTRYVAHVVPSHMVLSLAHSYCYYRC